MSFWVPSALKENTNKSIQDGMNQIRSIQKLSEKELECGILSAKASWHKEYEEQAYIYFGGLNKELTEGDILTIFSQYGIPVDIKLVRDKETRESKGFGYLKYEDQRSTVLAVDNLNGATIAGRTIKVDHAFYTPRDDDWQYTEAVQNELKKDIVREQKHNTVGLRQIESGIEENRLSTEIDNQEDDFADPIATVSRNEVMEGKTNSNT